MARHVHNPLTAPTKAWLQTQRDSKKLLEGNHLAEAERFVEENPRFDRRRGTAVLKESRSPSPAAAKCSALAALAIMATVGGH